MNSFVAKDALSASLEVAKLDFILKQAFQTFTDQILHSSSDFFLNLHYRFQKRVKLT